ncbi:hypothetical protein BV210_00130 [Halorientalis sp. IM1011]|nr:hypothetical protein BV210_00130 [Halorientalis sp. IM1011]
MSSVSIERAVLVDFFNSFNIDPPLTPLIETFEELWRFFVLWLPIQEVEQCRVREGTSLIAVSLSVVFGAANGEILYNIEFDGGFQQVVNFAIFVKDQTKISNSKCDNLTLIEVNCPTVAIGNVILHTSILPNNP